MLRKKVIETIKKYNLLESGDRIVIGVSGGPDSVCLLNVLNDIKEEFEITIFVAHVNHMLRKEADEETEYVKEFCEKINVECFVKKANIEKLSKEKKAGTEETGRILRYEFFEEILQKTKSNKIATAHNLNDKVETILMNILRGSAINGLKGIETIREGKFIRPLIEIERNDIEKYCNENELFPKYDKSNDENIYTRNKVRNIVIPYIKENYNPNIIKTINRLSEIATEESNFIEKKAKEEYQKVLLQEEEKEIILNLKRFNLLDKVIEKRIILYAINKIRGTIDGIEKVNIDDILKLCNNNIGNKYLIPTKYLKISVGKSKIFITYEQ